MKTRRQQCVCICMMKPIIISKVIIKWYYLISSLLGTIIQFCHLLYPSFALFWISPPLPSVPILCAYLGAVLPHSCRKLELLWVWGVQVAKVVYEHHSATLFSLKVLWYYWKYLCWKILKCCSWYLLEARFSCILFLNPADLLIFV